MPPTPSTARPPWRNNLIGIDLKKIVRPVKDWSDEEIARRWWNLLPSRRNKDGSPAEPAETDLKPLMADAKMLVVLRVRLSSISWFMRCTSEVIARLANAEEKCSGRFWKDKREGQKGRRTKGEGQKGKDKRGRTKGEGQKGKYKRGQVSFSIDASSNKRDLTPIASSNFNVGPLEHLGQ